MTFPALSSSDPLRDLWGHLTLCDPVLTNSRSFGGSLFSFVWICSLPLGFSTLLWTLVLHPDCPVNVNRPVILRVDRQPVLVDLSGTISCAMSDTTTFETFQIQSDEFPFYERAFPVLMTAMRGHIFPHCLKCVIREFLTIFENVIVFIRGSNGM